MIDFSNPFIQVAGIVDREEAEMLLNCGVNLLGFPLRLDYHREDISDKEASDIIRSLEARDFSVLITYLNSADEICRLCKFLNLKIVQIHGDISANELTKLKSLYPAIKIIKSLIVAHGNYNELETLAHDFAPYVDAFIADTFDPRTGACGASGKTHDWSISRKLSENLEKPLILAGGLNPANVPEAILRVKPAGVDVHTGVEDKNGRKNPELVKSFVRQARKGFDLL